MKKKTGPVLQAITLITTLLCIGWADDWEGIKAASGKLTSVRADFVQEKHMKILSRPLVSRGVFFYQGPGSLRWEYQTPVQSILLMHDGETKRYVQGAEGITEDSGAHLQFMQIVLQEIARFLGGRFDENPSFDAGLELGRKIVLTPKEASFSKLIRRIEVVLSDRPGLIESVTIYESEDSFTTLMFKNADLNRKIPNSLFRNK